MESKFNRPTMHPCWMLVLWKRLDNVVLKGYMP